MNPEKFLQRWEDCEWTQDPGPARETSGSDATLHIGEAILEHHGYIWAIRHYIRTVSGSLGLVNGTLWFGFTCYV